MIIMIGDDSEGVKSLTSMIGKTYFLTGFHMKSNFSPENFSIKKTVLEIILSFFLK